jgi:ABC-type branched-subunit amino acid transport system substrate-binding protein
LDHVDYSSYLTKLTDANPEVVYLDYTSNEPYLTIAKQMMELGGWGNMKVMCMSGAEAAKKLTGAQGWYLVTPWLPDSQYPASQKFVQDFQAVNGNKPNPNQVYFYNSLWTAIYAIKLAGTDADRAKIIQVSRSGNLEWDTPMGYARFGADGLSGLHETLAQIEGKNVVSVVIPQ